MNKKFYSIAAAVALLGLASCSSDDVINDVNPGDLAKGENYMAFTISNVGDNSRATSAITSEDAVANEGNVSTENVRFYFYDANGNAFNFDNSQNVNEGATANMVKPSTVQADGSILTGVLVLGKADPKAGYVGTVPSQVLCVANATSNEYIALQNISLADALEKVSNLPTSLTSTSNFMMTSATWAKTVNEAYVVTTADDNIESFIKTTPSAAQANPININIERLAAKVRATYNANINVQAEKVEGEDAKKYDFLVDGKKATFSLAINGWQLRNTAVQAYSFKHLTPANYTNWNWWNNEANKRSFWAETTPGTLANTTYDIYSTDQFKYQSTTTEGELDTKVAYCYENTTSEKTAVFNRFEPNATALVVKGTLSLTFAAEGENEATTVEAKICRWFGSYYLESTLKDMIAKSYNSANSTTYTANNVKFVKNDAQNNSYRAVIKTGVDADGNDITVSAGDTFTSILWWKDCLTSYYLNIEHQTNVLGVVRNHIYDYTFDGVVGLGYPGNDPEIPGDEETFVAAKLNVLNWNVVKNTITLE